MFTAGSPQSQHQNSPAAGDHFIHSSSDVTSPRSEHILNPYSPREPSQHHVTSSVGGSSLGSALSEMESTDDEVAVRTRALVRQTRRTRSLLPVTLLQNNYVVSRSDSLIIFSKLKLLTVRDFKMINLASAVVLCYLYHQLISGEYFNVIRKQVLYKLNGYPRRYEYSSI